MQCWNIRQPFYSASKRRPGGKTKKQFAIEQNTTFLRIFNQGM
jgi:hypothetical protein